MRLRKYPREWAIGTRIWINWSPHYLHKATGRIVGYWDPMFPELPRPRDHYFVQLLENRHLGLAGIASDIDREGIAFIPSWTISIVPPWMWD